MKKYDFGGWATRNNLKCSDGRIIMKDAFKENDGVTVPLVWNHNHDDPKNILGHALLQNREEGVYTYGSFNDTEEGQRAKSLVEHGDIVALSIYANHLKQQGPNVVHGSIKEVSLVLAGANPRAFIDSVISHGEGEDEEEGTIYAGDMYPLAINLEHADAEKTPEDKDDESGEEEDADKSDDSDDETVEDVWNSLSDDQKNVAYAMIGAALEENGSASGEDGSVSHAENDETVKDVFDTFTEKQKNLVYALIAIALKEADEENQNNKITEEDENGGNEMKHNIFDEETNKTGVLSHADQEDILKLAKQNSVGSFQDALAIYAENNEELAHGFDSQSLDVLFPDYKDVKPGAPEMLTTDQGWITQVLNKVHKSPISRIRTRQTDIRNRTNLRGHGYKTKGSQKVDNGDVSVLYRTTDPQTVYVKSFLNRDDIVDITDFDVVNYMYNIDRMNLNEELATAMMLGDGRGDDDADRIDPTKIRPVWTDNELYTIHAAVDVDSVRSAIQGTNTSANFGDNYIYAEAIIQTLLYAKEDYKGSGTPDMYVDPHLLNVMLLARDLNGRRIYENVNDLKAALNVGNIITAEQFAGKTRVVGTGADAKTMKLLAIVYNFADYTLGATKGGEITHFTDFDIDFNQEKSLLETRCSGANTKVKSAIVLEEEVNP